jgi:pimeloyl-ACP methyl ester carboxylesterase
LFTGNIGPIPVVIHILATARNKTGALISVIRAFPAQASPGGGNQMLLYAIKCAEPWEADPPAALSSQRGSFAYHTDLESAQFWQYVCPLIPKSAAVVGHEQLTVSEVPVLAFNGDADPIEQPRNMARAQEFWPHSREIALPGQGHDVSTTSWGTCASQLTDTFIEQASVAHLDTSCVSTVPAPVFDITLP